MQQSDLQQIMRAAGVEPTTSSVTFTGVDDPIYPSPLRLGAGMASVLANVAGAIDEIAAAKTGRRQAIEIDVGHALVSISSMWLLKVDGVPATEAFDIGITPGQGIFPTRDGRLLYLLSGFPHIVERTMAALGCADVDALPAHIAARDAAEMEEALVEAQLTGVVVRDQEEWRQHPQGRLLAGSPAVEIEKIGEAPPTPLPAGEAPLAGLRVLDATRVLAGPTIARTLAAFGADVLHVGSPHVPDMAGAQVDTGHGKRRAFVDLDTADGVETMWNLIEGADVFSQSYRAQSLARRGLGAEAVAARNPGIVYLSENAYGPRGPWHEKRGFDGNVQAASGIHALSENPAEMQGAGPPAAMNDYGTGYWGAYGVLEALRRRAVEGGSWHVKVSLGQTASWFLRLGTPHDITGVDPEYGFALAERFSEDIDSDYGRLTRLRFPIAFSGITPHWGPPVKPGTDEPAWLPRNQESQVESRPPAAAPR